MLSVGGGSVAMVALAGALVSPAPQPEPVARRVAVVAALPVERAVVQVGQRLGAQPAADVSATRLQNLAGAVTLASKALAVAREQLAVDQGQHQQVQDEMVKVGQEAYMEAAAGQLPASLQDFGITQEQQDARRIVQITAVHATTAARVERAKAQLKRADEFASARRRDLEAEKLRIAGLKRAAIERARAAAEARTAGRPGSSARFRGQLAKPVDGRFTSSFGMRFDPYYNVSQLHAGIDLAAGIGTPIHAAADGYVIRAGVNGGYGNYTCVSHGMVDGGRLSTCYAHQSAIGVRPGQRVSRGEVIGRVGNTGASTGPHLHFEVRIGGKPVDPLGWLP